MHVMARGVRKLPIFLEESDYEVFLMILRETVVKIPCSIHAYCLMTNHFHLLVSCMDQPIGDVMKRLMSSYALYFNRKYNYSGHLFESRFKSTDVRTDIYFMEVSRYIHLNPVKAGIVKLPEEYAYSSYSAYLEMSDSPIVDKNRLITLLGTKEVYKDYVEKRITASGTIKKE